MNMSISTKVRCRGLHGVHTGSLPMMVLSMEIKTLNTNFRKKASGTIHNKMSAILHTHTQTRVI